MRDLKFRDYDMDNKKLRYFNMDSYDRQEHDAWGNIMQFTGMLDVKGVEIYEGDIVQVTNNYHGKPGNITFKAKIIYNEHVYGYQISYQNMNNHFVSDCMKSGYFFLVIGNVHENTELL